MRHKLLITAGFLLALGITSTDLNAQVKKSAKVIYFDDDMCFGGSMNAVSPNGQFVVGHAPDFSTNAYLWNRETNELTLLNGGATDDQAEAYSVSNNGVVAGNFNDVNSPDGKGTPTLVPGYWKDGQWTILPRIPGLGNIKGGMNGSASAISADGKTICGDVLRVSGKYVQVLWKDGELQDVSEEELLGQGHATSCFALDGKIIGGFAEHDDGSRSPAVFIDGVTTRIDGLMSATEIYEKTGEDAAFFGGQAQSISADGKFVVGYFDPEGDGSSCKPFIWNQETGVEYIAEAGLASVITNDKTIYGTSGYMGSAFIYKDGIMTELEDYLVKEYNLDIDDADYSPMSTPLGVSADGKVIVGWGIQVVDLGSIMRPMIIILEETGVSIESIDAQMPTIASNVITNDLQIDGQYTSAQMFNTVGSPVLNDKQLNGNLDCTSLAEGVYFVKISNGSQTQTFKVIKK